MACLDWVLVLYALACLALSAFLALIRPAIVNFCVWKHAEPLEMSYASQSLGALSLALIQIDGLGALR